jgi:hypothetical protein
MLSRVEFEQGRLYVEPRQSVLFFARHGEERLRCYVKCEVLVEHFGARREPANAYKFCLCAYDRNVEAIHEIAAQLIDARAFASDGAIVITREALEARRLAQAA